MAASHIPNLNTLRRGRGRGRGTDRADSSAPSGKDRVVQGTDNDASVSRLSAVELGYLDDAYATALTPPGSATRRLPIINRGETPPAISTEQITDQHIFTAQRNLRSYDSYRPARSSLSRSILARSADTKETDYLVRCWLGYAHLPSSFITTNTGLCLPRD